jgi:16S rRNA C967 or C1407 C5-methylase (RsmB/RsmF family)
MSTKFRETHLFAFLRDFEERECPLDLAFSNYLRAHKSIGAHDRRFLGDTIYALIRWKGLLNVSSWEKRYAAWKTLDLGNLSPTIPAWARSGGSEWLFQELSKYYGKERAFDLCRALTEPAPLTIRVNGLKTSREAILSSWQDRFPIDPCSFSKDGIRFRERTSLTALTEFKAGFFEIQDEGSQMVADLVQATPGEQVLDYCAGSGGKTLAIAPRLLGKGQIYLHDIRPKVLQEARKRLSRAGVQNAQFLLPDHPRLSSLKNKIDWVLADVPCSGSGTFRRNPDMKWRVDEALLERIVPEQREIFEKAVPFVKPGGRIVYATCSIFPRENEEQVAFFLQNLPLTLEGTPLSIMPSTNGPDGFFAAVFCKK